MQNPKRYHQLANVYLLISLLVWFVIRLGYPAKLAHTEL